MLRTKTARSPNLFSRWQNEIIKAPVTLPTFLVHEMLTIIGNHGGGPARFYLLPPWDIWTPIFALVLGKDQRNACSVVTYFFLGVLVPSSWNQLLRSPNWFRIKNTGLVPARVWWKGHHITSTGLQQVEPWDVPAITRLRLPHKIFIMHDDLWFFNLCRPGKIPEELKGMSVTEAMEAALRRLFTINTSPCAV